jgi:dTDP-4-dehydrorhamnose 3,5-epimerase
MIEGVTIKKLKVIPDERGRLMEMLRDDDDFFESFGQAYMTTVYPGVVKAWHYHKKQTDHIAVVNGMIKMVLCDWREESPTCREIVELYVGEHNPLLVRVPPMVLHGWKGIGDKEAIAINIPDRRYEHDSPDEERLPYDSPEVGYNWETRFF